MKTFMPTLIALILLAGMGAYTYHFETEDIQDVRAVKVVQADPDTLTAVTLEDTAGDTSVTLEKSGEDWKVTAPLQAAADSSNIKNIVNRLKMLKAQRLVAEKKEGQAAPPMKDYGLDAPTHKVSFTDNGAKKTLLLGADNPLGNSSYVAVEGEDRVYLVTKADLEVFKKDLFAMRDKSVLTLERDQVLGVEITHRDGRRLKITRAKKDAGWQIEHPVHLPADKGVMSDMLFDLGRIKAEAFADEQGEDLKRFGLDEPVLTCKLTEGGDGAVKTLLVGDTVSDNSSRVYVKRDTRPTVFEVEAYLVKKLRSDVAGLRDKSLVRLEGQEIATLSVKKDGRTVTARLQDDSTWHFENPLFQEKAGTAATSLTGELIGLKAESYLDPTTNSLADLGLEKAEYEITLGLRSTSSSDEGKAPEAESGTMKLFVGKKADDGGRYMRIEGDDSPVLTKVDLSRRLDRFMDRHGELLPFDQWNIKSITMIRGGDPLAIEVSDKGDWQLVGAGEADSSTKSAFREVSSALARLAGKEFIDADKAALTRYDLDEPRYTVTVRLKAKDDVYKVDFSRSKDGQVYAHLKDSKWIARIDPEATMRIDMAFMAQGKFLPPAPAAPESKAPAPDTTPELKPDGDETPSSTPETSAAESASPITTDS